MLRLEWVLAPCQRIAAYRAGARLGIVADVIAPSSAHIGRVREVTDRERPPRYAIEWQVPPDDPGSRDEPLVIVGVFLSALDVHEVSVASAGSEATIQVALISDATFDQYLGGSESIWESFSVTPIHPTKEER